MHICVLTTLFKVPVILVGNKIDLRGGEVTNEALEDEIIPIMNEFKVCVYESLLEYSGPAQNLVISYRKSRRASSVRQSFLSTFQKSSILPKRQSFTPPLRYTTLAIMYAFCGPCSRRSHFWF